MIDVQKTFEEAFDEVIREARKEGLSVYQWLMKHYKEFKPEAVIDELYSNFIDMVVHKIPSEFSGKVPESFEEYLNECLKAIEYRIASLEYNKRWKTSGFEGLKRTGLIEEMKDLPKGLGEGLTIEEIDFLNEVLKLTKEAIKNYLNRR